MQFTISSWCCTPTYDRLMLLMSLMNVTSTILVTMLPVTFDQKHQKFIAANENLFEQFDGKIYSLEVVEVTVFRISIFVGIARDHFNFAKTES